MSHYRPLSSTVILLSAGLLFLSMSSLAATIYVKWDSPNNGPGSEWDHAYHTIQAGINAGVSGDEVWVARGTYVERITLKDGIALYGGYAGSGTTRDIPPLYDDD